MLFFPPRWGTHANMRKRKFGISEKQIAFTWLYGESHPDRDYCWRLIGEEVTLITDPLQLFIITLFPNRYKDRFVSRNARLRRADGNVRLEWVDGFYDPAHLQQLLTLHKFKYIYSAAVPTPASDVTFDKLAQSFDSHNN